MSSKQGLNVKKMCVCAFLAALTLVITWAVKVPVPGSSEAYLNIGDAIVYISGFLLGPLYGAAAAGIGSLLADILVGATFYAPATLLIKALMAVVCALIARGMGFFRYAAGCVAGGAIMVAGYAGFEALFFGLGYALVTVIPNLLQWAGGVAVALALYKPSQMLYPMINERKI